MPVERSPPNLTVQNLATKNVISPAQIASPSNYINNPLSAHAQTTPLSWSFECTTPTLTTNNNLSFPLPQPTDSISYLACVNTSSTVTTQACTNTTTITTASNFLTTPIMSVCNSLSTNTLTNTQNIITQGNIIKEQACESLKNSLTLNEQKIDLTTNESVIVASKGAIPKTTKVESIKDINKTLKGIDRYFLITKRKRSPNSSKNNPTPKQTKKAETTETMSQNRFSLLDTNDVEQVADETVKQHKPPALFLREQNSNILVNSLTATVGKDNFFVESLRRGNVLETKIQTFTENNYRKIASYLDLEKKSYYTHQLKSSKGLSVVLKGIESNVPICEITNAIEKEGYKVMSVHNIKNKEKIPQPLFRVEITFESSKLKRNEPHPIYNLRYLLHRRITVEEPRKRKDPPQCLNCQEFGHTKSYCKLPAVCVICGDVHKTSECTKTKNDPKIKKCSNCGGNHTANYRGCPVFIQIKKNASNKSAYRRFQSNDFPQFSSKNNISTQNMTSDQTNNNYANYTVNPLPIYTNNMSYAQAAQSSSVPFESSGANNNPEPRTNKESSHKSPLENSIELLIQTMNNFISNMQVMMQELLRNQGMLLQAFAYKQ